MLADYDVRNPRISLLDEIKDELSLKPHLKESIKLAEGLKVISCYETLQTAEIAKQNSENRYARSGSFKSTVDTYSALLRLLKNREDMIPVNSDHTNMVKFDHQRDITYEKNARICGDSSWSCQGQSCFLGGRTPVSKSNVSGNAGPVPIVDNSNLEAYFKHLDISMSPTFQEYDVCIKLDKLKEILQARDPIEPRPLENKPEMEDTERTDFGQRTAVLHGMGGAGKSQIALEFAFQFSRCYTSIFWIDADNVSRTTDSAYKVAQQLIDHYTRKWRASSDYSQIANILGILGTLDDSGRIKQSDALAQSNWEIAVKAVHNWLGRKGNQRWLLLINNYDDARIDLDKLIPICEWGSVIVTTWLTELNVFGVGVEVETIGLEAGLELLLRRSEKTRKSLNVF
ncbi:hypothetical protein RUND412_008689, partial [Rhizina undulata]